MKNKESLSSNDVGIWIRVSTEDQARGDSPEHHELRARGYAESKGWNVKDVYHLEAVSGKSVMGHPECERMLEAVRSGTITGLIFSKIARLARNTKELLEFADIFQENNCAMVSLQESIDTTSAVGRLFYTLIAAMAQWEREEIGERIAASVPIRAKLGKSLGGLPPLGYHWVNGKLIPNPQTAPILKEIYNLFLEHKRLKTVARMLNESGYRTNQGKQFSDMTVKIILQNPVSKGLRRANYQTKKNTNGKYCIKKPESDWIYTEVEPVVSEVVWNQCNDFLRERSIKNSPKTSKKTNFLFAGFLYCHCGEKMYAIKSSHKYICQKCRNKIPIVDIEGVFREQLKDYFYSPQEIDKYINQFDETIKSKDVLLNTLQTEHNKLTKNIEKIYQLYLDEQLSKEGFGKKYKPLEERLNQLEAEIPRLQGELDYHKISKITSDQTITDVKDLHSRWSHLEFVEKRQIIENITDSIIINTDSITINLCYLPTSHPLNKQLNGKLPKMAQLH